jgi:ankyrin repeat protein
MASAAANRNTSNSNNNNNNSEIVTTLRLALEGNHKHTALALIEHNASVMCNSNEVHWPLLSAAADKQGWHDVVVAMLAKRADPNVHDVYGYSPLRFAAERGCLQSCLARLEAKASLRVNAFVSCTAFHYAAEHGHATLVPLLVEHMNEGETDVLDGSNAFGYTAVALAAKRGFLQVCVALLDAKADVDSLNAVNREELKAHPQLVGAGVCDTPIAFAVEENHSDVCRLLLERRARVDLTNSAHQSALVCAAINGNAGVCAALIEHKAHLAREMAPALRFAMQHCTDTYEHAGPPSRKLLAYANKAGAAFTVQARRARDQCVASHWTDSPLFDWHLVHEIAQYIEYPTGAEDLVDRRRRR